LHTLSYHYKMPGLTKLSHIHHTMKTVVMLLKILTPIWIF